MNKQFKKTLKEKLLIEGGKTLIVVVFLGLFSFFMIGHFKNVAAQSGPIIIGGGSPSNQERFEITTGKDAFAEFNPQFVWDDGYVEDYGTFKLFLGSPLQLNTGGGCNNVTTVLYYSPANKVKVEKDVKLIVKKKRLRGDPTFFRGTDYNNDTRLSKIHIITDAVLYDEETNELTYNFVLSYYESDVPKDMKVTKILAEGKNIVLADIP